MLSGLIIKRFVIILFSINLFALSYAQSTYYIDNTSGSDSNNGLSKNSAWKTVNKVNLSSFSPGDSILFKSGGIWNEGLIISSSGTPSNPITISSYNTGNKPKIQILQRIDYGIIFYSTNNVVIENFEVTGECCFGICVDGGTNVTIQNCYIHHISVNNEWHGILLKNVPDYTKILNNEISYCGAEGIYGDSDNIEIGYNYIHDIDLAGNVGDCIQLNLRATNFHVHHNILDHSTSQGPKGVFVTSHGYAGDINLNSNGIFEYNTCIGGPNDDFGYSSTATGEIIRYNVFTSDFKREEGNCIKASGIIHNNIISGYGRAIFARVQTVQIYNNNIVNCDRGLDVNTDLSFYVAFKNNILSNISLRYYVIGKNCIFESSNNLFGPDKVAWDYKGNNITSLDELKSYNIESNSIYGDPCFLDKNNCDYRLLGNSPAMDAGTNVGITHDLDSNQIPFNNVPDIGAYEFVIRNPSDTLPHAPSDITGYAPFYHQIILEWSDNSDNEYGFEIERSVTSQSGFSRIYTTYFDVTSFTDNNLSPETTYYYRIRSYNNIGNSNYSEEISITTPVIPPPNAPSSLSSTNIKGRSVSLTWNDNSNDEAYFELERSNMPDSNYSRVATINSNQTIYTDTGLSPVTAYFYRIRACSEHGCSNYSNELAITTTELQPPACPTNLTATNITKNSVLLHWTDNSNNEEGFRIYRSLTPATGYTQVAVLAPNSSQYTNSQLNPATTYYYRILAYNEDGNSDYSNELSITTLALQPPLAPSNLKATIVNKNSINIEWTDNSTIEDGFYVYRSLTSGTGYTLVTTLGANINHYTNYELNPSTTYFYRIRAYNEDGYSAYSNEISVMTLSPQPPPVPDSLQSTAVTKKSVTLEWIDDSGYEEGFIILRSLTSGTGYAVIDSVDADAVTYTDSGLNPSTSYYYVIVAFNEYGNSAYSDELDIITLDPVPPLAPSDLKSTIISKKSVTLAWSDNSNNENGFIVLRSLLSKNNFITAATLNPNTTVYTDYGLLPDISYSYIVFAFNEDGNSGNSNILNVKTFPLELPDAPANLRADTISYTWLTLSWDDNAANETGYSIERTSDTVIGYTVLYDINNQDLTILTDTGLLSNKTYFYRLRAYNTDGYSGYSNVLEISTPRPKPPLPPSSLSTSEVTLNSITLSWYDNSTDETGFIIKRAVSLNGDYNTIRITDANETSFIDNKLQPNTTYYYLAKAINNAGQSNNSNTAIASTMSLSESKRLWDGLVAYYNFNLNSDSLIHDFSNYEQPLNLTFDDKTKVIWYSNNRCEIAANTFIKSVNPATKVVNAIKKTNEVTFECWIKPSTNNLYGLSSILTISNSSEDMGVTLAQEYVFGSDEKSYNYLVRLKTKATSLTGAPNLYIDNELSYLSLHHLAYVRKDDGQEKIYLNGEEVANGIRPESLDNWKDNYYLILGNNADLNSPWYGTYYMLAIYNTALTESQILNNYKAGPCDNFSYPSIEYKLEISPNPSEGMVNIKVIPQSEYEYGCETFIQINDIMGTLFFSEQLEDPSKEQIRSYDLSEFSKGIYIVRILTNKGFTSERFIIK
jgi:hypothetical protein